MTISATDSDLKVLEDTLLNTSGDVPLHNRFRALFTLKALKNEQAIKIISKGFQDPSALLKHELAYCLGQTKNLSAVPVLEGVLSDKSEDPMVRHEAAEALGALSASQSIPILKEYLTDPERTVRETCEIAIAKVEWDNSDEGKKYWSGLEESTNVPRYTSVDPAPATSSLLKSSTAPVTMSVTEINNLKSQLLDKSVPLFERYRAMFALRNVGSKEAVDALADGFNDDSALFKHEIAFVFGQLLSPHSVPALISVLRNTGESDMVRHEAAEALGGIATPECLPHLKEWMTREDSPRVVKESCQVAVDMWEYENSDQFQYANGLTDSAANTVAVGA